MGRARGERVQDDVFDGELMRFLRGAYPGMVAGLDARTTGPVAAEDAVQEALIRAWERAARGEAVDSLPGWVGRVAANLLLDGWRRARAEERALTRLALQQPGLYEGIPAPAALTDVDEEGALAALVSALPRGQRRAVLLHYYADLPVREVARRLGVGEGTVKRSLFRARCALARALGPGYPGWAVGSAQAALIPQTALTAQMIQTTRRSTVKGWYMAGTAPEDYTLGIAGDETHEGQRVAYLRSTAKEATRFGTLMQMIGAEEYRGQRLRFSAALRTQDVTGWVGLWMRVDGPEPGRHLAFDNMQGRSVTGTTDWRRYEVVLDVGQEAQAIGLGVLLDRTGEVRVAGFRFEPVSEDIPTTARVYPTRPQNLDLSGD